MLSVLKQQLWSLKGYRGGFTDDVLGFDPNGGGLHALTRDIQSVAEPWLTETGISDDWFGLDPNGNGLTDIANIVGPAVIAYFTGGALGGAMGGAAEGAAAADAAFVAADAAQLTAQGLSVAQVEATLVASGVSSTAASTAAAAAASGATETAIANTVAQSGSDVFTSQAAQQSFTNDPQLIQQVGKAYNIPKDQVSQVVQTKTNYGILGQEPGVSGNMFGNLSGADNLGTGITAGQGTGVGAANAGANSFGSGITGVGAAGGTVGAAGGIGGAGTSLTDIYNTGKQINQAYNAGKNLMGQSGLGTLGNLGAGAASWLQANQYADKQANLANDLINKADPYLKYRQETEIPFLKDILGTSKSQIDASQSTLDSAKKALSTKAPTLASKMYEAALDTQKYSPSYNLDKYLLNDPTLNAMREKVVNTDSLGGDYRAYQDMLRQSYEDPMAVYNSPEMQAQNAAFMNEISRRDAAAGRNSQYGARSLENQLNYLTKVLPAYRTGLGTAAGTAGTAQNQQFSNLISGMASAGNISLQDIANQINQQTQQNQAKLGSSQLSVTQQNNLNNAQLQQAKNLAEQQAAQNQAAIAKMNAITAQGSALSNLFGTQANAAANYAKIGTGLPGAGAGAQAYGNMMTEANKASTYAANPFIQAVGQSTTGTPSGLSNLFNSASNQYTDPNSWYNTNFGGFTDTSPGSTWLNNTGETITGGMSMAPADWSLY